MTTNTQTDLVWTALKKTDDDTHQITANLTHFKYAFDGDMHTLSNEDVTYEIEPKSLALKQLCKLAKVPAGFIDKNNVDLNEAIFAEYYAKIEKPEVVLLTDKTESSVRAILPQTYYRVPNWQTYAAIQKAIPNIAHVRTIGAGWEDIKTAFVVTYGEPRKLTYGSNEEPTTVDVTPGVQVVCSELGGKKVTVNPILALGSKIIAPVLDKAGDFFAVKYDDFNSEELRDAIYHAAFFDPTEAVQNLQANSLKLMDDAAIREWVTELSRFKGASNSLLKKLEKSFQVVEGETPVISPMSATETALYLLNLVQNFDKPLSLGLERALAYQLGVKFQ